MSRTFFYLFTFLPYLTFASSIFTLSGTVLDESGASVPYANIVLFSLPDSTIAKVSTCNDIGKFEIQVTESGAYYVEVSHIGYAIYRSPAILLQKSIVLQDIRLKQGEVLSEVVVKETRKLIDITPDKTIYNVSSDINARSTNAIELLSRAPGVMVDMNNTISMFGKSNVAIYVNGRKKHLQKGQLASYLAGLTSDNIKSIEIITNPSSKYDASGTAGVINLIMKKPKNFGWLTRLNTGHYYGKKYRGLLGASVSYRNKHFTIYGKATQRIGGIQIDYQTKRRLEDYAFNTSNQVNRGGHNFKGDLGLDYDITKKSTLGLHGDYFQYSGNSHFSSDERIFSGIPMTYNLHLLGGNQGNFDKSYKAFNANYQRKITQHATLVIDGNYGSYQYANQTEQENQFLDPVSNDLTQTIKYQYGSNSTINIKTAVMDYSFLALSGQISVGTKVSKINTKNSFNHFNFDQSYILDTTRSSTFLYEELILSSYFDYQKKISDRLKVQFGLRGEQSKTEGRLLDIMDNNIDTTQNKYLDFFPSFGITYTISKTHTLKFKYGRRINRPNYHTLNPFVTQISEYNYKKGNPFLKPEYAHNFNLSYTYRHSTQIILGYSKLKNMIGKVEDTTNTLGIFDTWQNIDQTTTTSLSIIHPTRLKSWWTLNTSMGLYYDTRKNNIVNNISLYSGMLKTQNSFKLPKKFQMQISLIYLTPHLYEGNYKMHELWYTDIALKKSLFHSKASITVAFKDIFHTKNYIQDSYFSGQYLYAKSNLESRQIRVNFNYSFGNNKVKARKRQLGIEGERKRTKN